MVGFGVVIDGAIEGGVVGDPGIVGDDVVDACAVEAVVGAPCPPPFPLHPPLCCSGVGGAYVDDVDGVGSDVGDKNGLGVGVLWEVLLVHWLLDWMLLGISCWSRY